LGLVEAIRHLISERDEAKRLGAEAKRLIHKYYTLDRQVKRIESLYCHLLNNKI